MAQSNYDLCKQGFTAINNFKRHRTLKDNANTDSERNYHELQMYKMFDSIELTMRALQSNERFAAKPQYTNKSTTIDNDEDDSVEEGD